MTTGLVNTTVNSTVYSDGQLAVYEIPQILLSQGILSPQAPASAPLPPKPKKASPLNSHAPSTSTTVSVDSCEATGLPHYAAIMVSIGVAVVAALPLCIWAEGLIDEWARYDVAYSVPKHFLLPSWPLGECMGWLRSVPLNYGNIINAQIFKKNIPSIKTGGFVLQHNHLPIVNICSVPVYDGASRTLWAIAGKALESPNCSGKQRLGLCMVFDTRSNAFRIYSGRNRNAWRSAGADEFDGYECWGMVSWS